MIKFRMKLEFTVFNKNVKPKLVFAEYHVLASIYRIEKINS